jgi:hypothetical protein
MNTEGVEGITGAEAVDGKERCRAAVRRQIGAGADWIKVMLSLVLRLIITSFKRCR